MSLFVILIVFILIGASLSWYFISHDRGEKEPVGALWSAVGFGLVGIVLAVLLEALVVPHNIQTATNQPTALLLRTFLMVGIIEELCKFLPLAIWIYPKKFFNEHTDGIIYFALAGLGFGIPENILYALSFGAGTGVMRIVVTPIFHATTTAFVGYYLAKSKVDHKPLSRVAFALAGVMLLHGLYDFGLAGKFPILIVVSLMITLAMTTMLFILFTRANETDQAEGLSTAGANSFCRWCGYPNPKHNLYCAHCGKRA